MAIAAVSLGVQNKALNDELNDESKLVNNLAAQASKAQQVLEVLTAPSCSAGHADGRQSTARAKRTRHLPARTVER